MSEFADLVGTDAGVSHPARDRSRSSAAPCADTTFQAMRDVLCDGVRHIEAVNRGEIESMTHD